MNRNLLLFGVFLIVLGVGFGYYLLSLFGFLILIPALMAPSRPVPRPGTAPARQEARRIGPPPKPEPMASAPQPETRPEAAMMVASPGMMSQSQSYSPALFPNSMFPALSLSGTPQQQAQAPPPQQSGRDELVETGAMLALFKLFFG